jgi:hypothetical protein
MGFWSNFFGLDRPDSGLDKPDSGAGDSLEGRTYGNTEGIIHLRVQFFADGRFSVKAAPPSAPTLGGPPKQGTYQRSGADLSFQIGGDPFKGRVLSNTQISYGDMVLTLAS